MKWNKEEFSLTCLMILSAFLAVLWGCKGIDHRHLPPVPVESTSQVVLHTNRNTNVVYLNWTNRPLIQPLQFPTNSPKGPVVIWAAASTNYGKSWYLIDSSFEDKYEWVVTTSNKLTGVVTSKTNGVWTNNLVVANQGPEAWYKVILPYP